MSEEQQTTVDTTNLWSSQILELQLKSALQPFFEEKLIDIIISFHGNLSTKCANFARGNMRRRKEEYMSLTPKTFTLNEFTIEVWLNCDRFPGKNEGWIAIRDDNSWWGASIHFQFYGNILQITRAGSADHWFVNYKFENRVWYHIAVTYPKHEFYVNGEFISEDKRLSEEVQLHDAFIGHWSNIEGNPDRIFCGKMKEFRWWNCRRTADQIKDNILCGAKPQWMAPKNGLIIYHSLDEYNNNGVSDLYDNKYKDKYSKNAYTKDVTDAFNLESLNLVCYTVAAAIDDDVNSNIKRVKHKRCISPITCDSVKRIIKYLHFYDIYDIENDSEMLIEYFEKEEHILNDFHHIMYHHLGEGSDATYSEMENEYKIIHGMVRKIISKCNLDKCQSFVRNNRLRGGGYRENAHKIDNDDIVQCYIDILDEIHCFFIHSYDYGMKVQSTEHKVNDESQSQSHAQDEDEGIAVSDYTDAAFMNMVQSVKTKSESVARLRAENRNGKFSIEGDYKEQQGACASHIGCYSFGVNLCYWGDDGNMDNTLFIAHDGAQVYAKYGALRQEILQNEICRLDIKEWIRIIQKMTLKYATNTAKQMRAQDVFNDAQIPNGTLLVHNIHKGDILTEQHIIAVILYCDYSEISYELTKTFRLIESDHNDISCILHRNAEFYHWSKLLKEAVNIYGEMVWTSSIKHFYSGVSSPMVFSSFVTEFFCPTSTSAQRTVASVFAKSDGIIIDLMSNSGGSLLKYFNCTFISCFADEDERLFFANTQHIYDNGRGASYSLKFSSILVPSNGHNYSFFLSILTFIDDLLNGREQPNVGVFITKKIAKVMTTLFRHFDGNIAFKSKHVPTYICDTFERYINDKKDIIIYGYYITQQKEMNKYLFHNDFLPHRTTPLPSLHLLFSIFVNCDTIKYIFDRYRKGHFSSKYIEALCNEIELIQNNNNERKRRIILESHQYEDALVYDGSPIHESSFVDSFQTKFKENNCTLNVENDGKRLVIEIS